MAQRSNRAAEVGRLIETASKGSYRTYKVTGAVPCAWGPPGGLLALKIHVQRKTTWESAGRDGAAGPRQSHADEIAAEETRSLVHLADSRVAGRHRLWPYQGAGKKPNFGGARCSAVPSFGIGKAWEAKSPPPAIATPAFPHHAHNPAPPAWLRVPPANQAAGPWYPSAIWGGRSCADAIGHLAAERLPEIDMQPACPCQCLPATGATKHNMGPSRMHAASMSASAGVTQPTGSNLSGDCSNQHITFTRHSAYACHQPHPHAPAGSLSTLPSEPAFTPRWPTLHESVCRHRGRPGTPYATGEPGIPV
ncbi:hypothetical protein SVAN01_04394 [Stagonosporopsis vannaccii]|nr:hypothetical protein SVAN01_04394 [Stagonosporopsis vannaccii]